MTARKPGVDKVWGDSPLRLYAWHLGDLFRAVADASPEWMQSQVRTEVNGRNVDSTRPEWTGPDWSPVEPVACDPRFGRIRSVAFIGPEVVVHLGPRTVFAYSVSSTAAARGALFRIERLLKEARRKPGTFLLRTWGAAIAVAAAFTLGVAAFRPWDERSQRALLAVGAALVVYLLAATYVGCFRRVLLEPAATREHSGYWQRNKDPIVAGTVATVIGGLMLTALLALGGLLS
jgi:hypothetical protein